MTEFLSQSIEKSSILWLLLSSIIGGGIGAMIKLSMGTILPDRYARKIKAKEQFDRYKIPLLSSADSLDRSLLNFIKNHKKGWYDDKSSDYYRISTLYRFGDYLGWCKIIEESEILGSGLATKKISKFTHHFYMVFKSMSGFYYFKDSNDDIKNVEESTVYRLVLTAIGELMISRGNENKRTLSFVEFTKKIDTDPDFIKWFSYLENTLLKNQKRNGNCARWNRLRIVSVVLRSFITHLDPINTHTSKRRVQYSKEMNKKVSTLLIKDINKMHKKGDEIFKN